MAIYDFDNIVRTKDLTHYVTGGNGSLSGVQSAFSQYAGTDYILFTMNSNYPTSLPVSYSDGVIAMDYNSGSTTYGYVIFPISPLKNINKIEADIKTDIRDTLGSYGIFLIRSDTNGTTNRVTLFEANPPSQMSDFQHIEIDVTNADVEYGYLAINYAYSCKATIKNIKFFVTDVTPSGGAGSGYIGNTLVSNKKMVGYNVPTSEAESTKTESVEDASESPVSGKPKIGNGHAKIRFLRDLIETNLSSLAKNTDFVNHRKVSGQRTTNVSFQYTFADLTAYYLSDWNLSAYPNTNSYENDEFIVPYMTSYGQNTSNGFAISIHNNRLIYGVKFDCKVVMGVSGNLPRQGFLELIRIDSGNTVTRIDLLRICRDPSTSYDPNNPSHRLATDDLYHTYEFVFDNPVTFDYIHINCSFVDTYVKNIKLLT